MSFVFAIDAKCVFRGDGSGSFNGIGIKEGLVMNKMKSIFLLVGIAALSITISVNAQAADIYKIDTAHSTIGFAVKHMLVSMTRGEFTDYEGRIQFDKGDLSVFSVDVVIQAKSIDTRNAKRDAHLKGKDFLEVETYPTITFKNAILNKTAGGYDIIGDLTMHGFTKRVTLPVTISGPIHSPFGGEVLGIAGEITINRQDFGISWNKAMDQGGFVVDNNVKLLIEIEAHKEEQK